MSLLHTEESEFTVTDDRRALPPTTVASMARTDAPPARPGQPPPALASRADAPGATAGAPAGGGGAGTSRWRPRLTGPGRRIPLRDGLFALGVVAVDVPLAAAGPTLARTSWPELLGLSLLCAAPIALRRLALWPAIALAVALAVALAIALAVATIGVSAVVGLEPISMGVAMVVLTYTSAASQPLRAAVAAALMLWTPVVVAIAVVPWLREAELSPAYPILTNVLLALVCFFIGRLVHARRAAIRVLEERARVAVEDQRALADQAVTEERRRIARDLHDVVAHHVSVMGVLATGARRVLPRDPGAVDEVLGTIEETSRTTLREMRRLLDVPRTDAEPAADLTPQPGLAGIAALAEQVREAGLPVSLRVDGVPAPLDPGVALTIYRIVQEALTNALKHAGAATAEVRLSFGLYWLIVEISDTGRGPTFDPNRLGHGLVGMRERVALYGGTLRTGPRPGGGFRVYAKMPMEQLGAPTGEGNR